MNQLLLDKYQRILFEKGYSLITDNLQDDYFSNHSFIIENQCNIKFTLRVIDVSLSRHDEDSIKLQESTFDDKMDALKKLNHPQIIQYVNHFLEEDLIFLIMERTEMHLSEYIKQKFTSKQITEPLFFSISSQLIKGVQSFLESKIQLGDISYGEIFVCKSFKLKYEVFASSYVNQSILFNPNMKEEQYQYNLEKYIFQLGKWWINLLENNQKEITFSHSLNTLKLERQDNIPRNISSFMRLLLNKEDGILLKMRRITEIFQEFQQRQEEFLFQPFTRLNKWEGFDLLDQAVLKQSSEIPNQKTPYLQLIWKKQMILSNELAEFHFILSDFQQLSHLSIDIQIHKSTLCQLLLPIYSMKELISLELNFSKSNIQEIGSKDLSFGLGQMEQLVSLALNLYWNNIDIENITSISTSLIRLKFLEFLQLNLGVNSIQSEGCQSLSLALAQMKNMSSLELDLQYNTISIQGAQFLGEALHSLQLLSTLLLNLDNNEIEGEGAYFLSNGISKLNKLKILSLNLGSNFIGDEGASKIAQAIQNLKSLESLTLLLESNEISTDGIIPISNALLSLSKLHNQCNQSGNSQKEYLSQKSCQSCQLTSISMDLSNNAFQEEGIQSLLFAISQFESLQFLSLTTSNFCVGYKEGGDFYKQLSKLKKLKYLSLQFGCMKKSIEGFQILFNEVVLSKQLTFLQLNLGRINHLGANLERFQPLWKEIEMMTQLVSLSLNLESNYIGCREIESLFQRISYLIKMTSLNLNLQKNVIDSEGLSKIQEGILKLQNLEHIDLNLKDNFITDDGLINLCSSLRILTSLKTLKLNVLSNKLIEGTKMQKITYELNQLLKLTHLQFVMGNELFQQNCLEIFQLGQLDQLNQLTYLEISFTHTSIKAQGTNSLCIGLSKMKSLTSLILNLKDNKITHEEIKQLIAGISNLNRLQILSIDLKNNQIGDVGCVAIANEIIHFKYLQELSLNLISNFICTEGMISILNAISELKSSLQQLSLFTKGNIYDQRQISIFSFLSKLEQLHSLKLKCPLFPISANSILSYLKSNQTLMNVSFHFNESFPLFQKNEIEKIMKGINQRSSFKK